jgi:MFS family permease
MQSQTVSAPATPLDRSHARVVVAASLGAMFEWYDFFVYGAVAVLLSQHFFQGVNETTSFIFALLGFAAGFAVRPLGAVLFGRLGDSTGRKQTFLITIILMGVSTALIGVLPTYAQIGVAAPVLLVSLRLLQGLALGGEYGGAATYVAEHAPPGRRGYYTSWIQLAGSLGFVLALLVVLLCRFATGEQFTIWGWRIPFLLSLLLLSISVYIRVQLEESPVFKSMQKQGKVSRRPLSESFGQWQNLKMILLALFGLMAGQTVVAYVSLVYVMFFLSQALRVDATDANMLIVAALAIISPFYPLFGRLSDRIGRKPVFMAGVLLATLTIFPIFKALTLFANPALAAAQQEQPVVIIANPAECSFQFDPLGKAHFTTSCDTAKSALTAAGIPYSLEAAPEGAIAQIRVGTQAIDAFDGGQLEGAAFKQKVTEFRAGLSTALSDAGYPKPGDRPDTNYPVVLLLICLLAIYAVLTYAPVAAWLVELFPPRIRYTSMSVPYHVGVGWFGGFLPSIAFAITAYTGDIYSGLWYPVAVATVTLIVGTLFVPETKGIAAED